MKAIRRLIPLILGATVVACDGDATGPSAYEVLILASQFDALRQSRNDAGDVAGALASAEAALALRSGARPTRVNITVDGVSEEYLAIETERAFGHDVTESPVLTLPIVSRTMIAWRGRPPQRVIAMTVMSDTGEFVRLELSALPTDRPALFGLPAIGTMFERGGEPWFAVGGGARTTRQTIGDSCPIPRQSSVSQALIPLLVPTACNSAVFFTRFDMRAVEGGPEGPVGARTRVIAMDGHEIRGIRLEYPPVPVMCPVCR